MARCRPDSLSEPDMDSPDTNLTPSQLATVPASSEAPPKSAEFLLIDDSEHDLALLRRAFGKSGTDDAIAEVLDGADAIDYLQHAIHLSLPLPRVIMTDLKMQRMDGFELTTWIRSQPEFQNLLVIVLSGSNLKEDAERALACGANFFLTKPSNLPDLEKMIRSLVEWLREKRGAPDWNERLTLRGRPFVRRWHS
jgi:CheY-like chemotaxis protein